MYRQKLAQYCKDNLHLVNIKLDEEHYYSSLPFCIIDSVFSIGIKYNTTKKVVERFSKYINIDTFRNIESDFIDTKNQYSINQFIELYKNNDISFITEKIYNNRCRTSSNNGILKSQAVLEFAEVLQKYNINYFQDIEKITNNLSFEKEIKWIKGQKSGISLKSKGQDTTHYFDNED